MTTTPSIIQLLEKSLRDEVLTPLSVQSIKDIAEICGITSIEDIFLLASLFAEEETGNISLELNTSILEGHMRQLHFDGQFQIDIEFILGRALKEKVDLLFSPQVSGELPKLLDLFKHKDHYHLSFQKHRQAGLAIETYLSKRFAADERPTPSDTLRKILHQILVERPVIVGGRKLELNIEQKIAVCLALSRNNLLLTGGPGTGKTSVVASILRALSCSGIPVQKMMLAAPTGRAAQRLTESLKTAIQSIPEASDDDLALLGLEGRTLHRLLNFSPSQNRFLRNQYNPLEADVVIVDEVSMIDLFLMQSLLCAILPECQLIFVGDRDQLPAVGIGGLLTTWIPDHCRMTLSPGILNSYISITGERPAAIQIEPNSSDRLVILNRTYRSGSSILKIAQAIRDGDESVVDQLQSRHTLGLDDLRVSVENLEGIHWIQSQKNPSEDLLNLLRTVAERTFVNYTALSGGEMIRQQPPVSSRPADSESDARISADTVQDLLNSFRILTVIHKSISGCDWINEYLLSLIRHQSGYPRSVFYYAGLPLMITRNSYEHNLFNGDVGIVINPHLSFRTGGLVAVFPRGEEVFTLPVSSLPAHVPAYAMTVHKSQGSEYEQVLLVLPDMPDHPLLTREILYTALTRAKRNVILYGSPQALSKAIRTQSQRTSWLSPWNGG